MTSGQAGTVFSDNSNAENGGVGQPNYADMEGTTGQAGTIQTKAVNFGAPS
jgi:hypothetical protein